MEIGNEPLESLEVAYESKASSETTRIAKLSFRVNWILEQIVQNFILFALSVAVIISFSYPYPGSKASSITIGNLKIVEFINNVIVFLISGVTLKVEDLKVIMKYKVEVVYGLVMINFVTTFLAFALVRLPFQTRDFSIGLTLFATVPTTLGVGVALTVLSKGDQVLSLFLTVVSNLLGILSIPLLLQLYLHNEQNVELNPATLAYRLTLTVLVPTIVGIGCRALIPGVAKLCTQYKQSLSMFSMTNLMMIVWMSLSSSRTVIFQQNPGEIVLVLLTAIIMHVLYLISQFIIVRKLLPFVKLKQAVSLIIMCSQKSSPVALSVIAILSSSSQDAGLLTIPCILGQLSQIFIGSFLTQYLAAWVEADALMQVQLPTVQIITQEEQTDEKELSEMEILEELNVSRSGSYKLQDGLRIDDDMLV